MDILKLYGIDTQTPARANGSGGLGYAAACVGDLLYSASIGYGLGKIPVDESGVATAGELAVGKVASVVTYPYIFKAVGGDVESAIVSSVINPVTYLTALSNAYHGYKRNNGSIAHGLLWAVAGGNVGAGLSIEQGFAENKFDPSDTEKAVAAVGALLAFGSLPILIATSAYITALTRFD
jgi:hypothetical protein